MNSTTVKKYKSFLCKGLALAIFLLGFIKILPAQNQFKNYGVSDGLPSSEAYCVMQDSRGYMWFGTDEGVCRFNGYEFKCFNTSNGLADNNVFEIKEDYKGRLWFRSFSGKLSYYYNDSVYALPVNDKLVGMLKNAQVVSLAIDSSDKVYLGIHGYMLPVKIDLKTGDVSFLEIDAEAPVSYICYIPGNGVINGSYYKNDGVPSKGHPIFRANLYILKVNEDGRIISKALADTLVSNYATHDKTIILPNGNMAYAIGSVFSVRNAQGNVLFSKKLSYPLLSIAPGNQNDVWIITMGNQPMHYVNGRIIQEPALSFLKKMFITNVSVDAEGGYWFTSLDNGVYYTGSLEYKIWTTEDGLQGNKINALKVAPDSTVWVATLRSNAISLIHNDSVTTYKIPDAPGITINDILFHPDKTVWLSTTTGTYILKMQKAFSLAARLEDNFGYNMQLNNDSSVWFRGVSQVSLLKVGKNKIYTDKQLHLSSRITSLCRGSGYNELWIGMVNDLLHYSNGTFTSLRKENPLFKTIIIDICRTGNNLWFATHDGIIVKTAKSNYLITVKDGLVSNFCKYLCPDHNGNIWVGTRNGVSEIIVDKSGQDDMKIKSIRNFHLPSLNEVNRLCCFGNMVYVGTNSGLTAFDMTKVLPDTVQPPIYITGIKINDRNIRNNGEQKQLKYDENYMVFNYTGLTYTNAGNVNYRYKMQGIDTNWQYTRNTSVQYPRLQPGSYTFLVSAMNEYGVWNKHPASFSFIIAPPFWATWWARAIMVLLVSAIVYWQFRSLKIRERRKAEISKLMTTSELRELKKQIDPHFLFNSLNTLYNLVQSKPDIAPEFVDKLAKFYRYTLDNKDREFTDLATEVEQGERYIKLLQIRFGKEFEVKWNIRQEHMEYFIPTFALQLLIENITKHNTIIAENPIYVNIKSTEDKILIVENQVAPRAGKEPSTGIGLNSIGQRYKLLTSKQIKISQTAERFVVELPLISYTEHESINN